ncbi:MAG TPA: hypothetical protein VHZ55_30380 [Bryobacteraceae bacterium]|nr:hypothetical protein [Bryobacteraceae bacterium]
MLNEKVRNRLDAVLEIENLNQTPIGGNAFQLPPLILHPFSSAEENSLLVESSRASLALQGLTPPDQVSAEDLDKKLLRGRYAELRMLFYIGKDIVRWTEQCAETAKISPAYADRRIRPETFAVFLVQHAPPQVRVKLEGWGVLDFRALFRRSMGLHAVFAELPQSELFLPDFLRRYHRFLDHWYEQRLKDSMFDRPEPGEFTFDLYASGEYSSMLEKSWSADAGVRAAD